MRWHSCIMIITGAATLAAYCAMGAPVRREKDAGGDVVDMYPIRESTRLVRVPMCRQSADGNCAVSALQSMLGYHGFDLREDALLRVVRSRDTARPSRMVAFIRSLGLNVEWGMNQSPASLRASLDRGEPVLLAIDARGEVPGRCNYTAERSTGHWVVLVGYDAERFYFMDPAVLGRYVYLSVTDFVARWYEDVGGQSFRRAVIFIRNTPGRTPLDPDLAAPLE